ncbi:MAG: type VI secretion system baseplate subunit TssK [Chitinispirillia bacterium]|nr:type VI secretion system baseplate subunit TssK [Chitinispirillia bacterium]MCL2267644.1 type VI secretion system baseplate subunit TssK [Chitinispirillia bacterium]
MPNNCKVLWKEGAFLQPHHFQLSERLQADHVNTRISSVARGGYRYGFTELEIDRDALLSGNFSIGRAFGVFPDGSCFAIGGTASGIDAPAKTVSRSFAAYCRPEQLALDIYLAIPVDGCRAGVGGDSPPLPFNGEQSSHGECRYIEKSVLVADELSSDNNKEIEVGEPNYLIRFEGEPLDGCTWLRVARLSKSGSGYMELRRDAAPPVLFTRVSDVLRGCVSGLLELLWARIGSLARCRRQNEFGQAFFSASEENSFRMLNALCTFTPLISRLHELPKIHPFDYYIQLTSLYGSLMSFSSSITPESFPPYDHDNPAASFIALTERVRDSLKVEFWTNCTVLPLEQINPSTWHCRFPDARLTQGTNLFLGISAPVEQKSLVIDVLQRVKAGSRDKLDMLISSSMQGLALIHVKNIPEGLAAKPGYVYFVIDRQGPLWQGVETSGTLGIHFLGGCYPDMKIELLALKHQG